MPAANRFRFLFLVPALMTASCTGIFSTVFGQDDPALIKASAATREYDLPFDANGPHYLLVQGVGGRFSHTNDEAWSFDWAMKTGTPILAARAGVVHSLRCAPEDRSVALEKRPSNHVRIQHEDGTIACYAHLDSVTVRRGASIAAGDLIAYSGNTGFSTQPHLHFHVERGIKTIPIAFREISDSGGVPRVGRFYPE